mmetsp:Transcript_9783/g.11690  ORF Transcript_9783/g.11690 Transcript_9783/m.11690 type:complete len:86 (-) Transcript_9783:191-448(-)|eukprot:jgi/Bigna1/62093/fgenesh1_kg.30_\
MMTGGYTDFRKAEEKEIEIVKKMAEDIAKKIESEAFKSFKVTGVKTQVVAGTNYTFQVEADEHKLHVTIWRKLDQTTELTKVVKV